MCVALPPEGAGPLHLPIFDLVLRGISVIGSIVGTRQDLADVFRLHALAARGWWPRAASWPTSTRPWTTS